MRQGDEVIDPVGLGRDLGAEEVRGWAERVLECGGRRRFGVISAGGEGLGGGGAAVGLAGSTKEAERSGKLGIWRGARLRLMPSADAFGRMPSADAFGHTFGLNPVILRNDLTGVLNVKHSRDDLLRHCADFIEFIQGRIFVISCLQRRP